ncbi:carboxypeptidase-like regulatory domain-containing protein, partial [Bacteroidota bacterium]
SLCEFISDKAISSIFSQRAVFNKETGEPIPYHAVSLSGTQYGDQTSENGLFTLTRIPPGDYILVATGIGYENYTLPVTVVANRTIQQNIYVDEKVQRIDEVKVSARRQARQKAVQVSIKRVTPKEIAKIPTIGTEPDLAQYLQVIPGVIFTGDQGGQLYIRGGSPIQNKVLLDGMVVYNPFHSIGLFSVFDSDLMNTAEVFTGGFNAKYGGRISSIMDITMRDGNKRRNAGVLSVSPFGAKILLEGPIVRLNEQEGGATVSYVFSAKTSYLKESSKVLYKYIDSEGLPFNYTDIFGKITMNGSNNSKLSLAGYNFRDKVNYKAISDLDWNSYGVGASVILRPEGYNADILADLSFSEYEITLSEENQDPRYSKINNFKLGLAFRYNLGEHGTDKLEYGISILGGETDFKYHNTIGNEIQIGPEYNTELGIYVTFQKKIGKLLIDPSFRIHGYMHKSYMSLEPRIGLKYNLTDNLRIKFAGGLYSQDLVAGNSDRDVVNLFYAFLQGIELLPTEFNGEPIKHKLQKSIHAIAGLEIDITNRLVFEAEAYIKNNTQLININRNQLYNDDSNNQDKPEYLRKPFIIENGNAYGFDMSFTYEYKKLYLYFVYSLGFVTRFDGVIDYKPHFDRRHNLNLVGTYTFGKDLNWEVGTRWNLGSGFPFTQTQGFYEKIPFNDGINTDYTTANGDLGIVYGPLNEGRLPYYHRLDINVKRTFQLGANSSLKLAFSITNAYNRNNIFYFSRTTNEEVYQLPFMPSIGLSLNF